MYLISWKLERSPERCNSPPWGNCESLILELETGEGERGESPRGNIRHLWNLDKHTISKIEELEILIDTRRGEARADLEARKIIGRNAMSRLVFGLGSRDSWGEARSSERTDLGI